MLELRNIVKEYKTNTLTQKALNNISINFRESEFASVLGPSGSGKTTLLNIIGGLDHATSGDLIINGVSTKKYKDKNWDTYRNNKVGFVLQSYNLIPHQTILKNVELALTISGISKRERRKRSKKALEDVGLKEHINKRPSQLSGGQMQRVAIARALVNNPEIILADEPTGALDSETSIQIMNVLKKISKEKLVIMVTHNPELANEYSSRIINLKDGKIISDSNPFIIKKKKESVKERKVKKTKMSFLTALSLSFNNLMTKKARTVLVSIAGSIGIIGIALILAVSNGFQNYVDSIQEDTLTSYPLTIMQESTDIASVLLSMQQGEGKNNKSGKVVEQQYLTSMFSSISTNDLESFNNYLNNNYKKVKKDISTIKYNYSVDPLIYTVDASKKIAKLNPSTMFSNMMGSSMLNSYSAFGSIYSQMINNQKVLDEQYDVLAGTWPKKYNEMVIVLSEPNTISDLLVYSLGLRDTEELNDMINRIMKGEKVDNKNDAKTFSYKDLMNVKLKLIYPTDLYKYNSKYNVYEDLSEDEGYIKNLYDNALDLKIVGVVTKKEGVSASALAPGVAYTEDLIDNIINHSYNTEIVKKQLANEDIDVFSNKRFDSKDNNLDFGFDNMISVDNKKLQEAFNVKIDQNDLKNKTENYMKDISNSITTDTTPAKSELDKRLKEYTSGIFDTINGTISINDIDTVVGNYLNSDSINASLKDLENKYVLPASVYKEAYSGLLKSLLQIYINSYYMIDPSLTTDTNNKVAVINNDLKNTIVNSYNTSALVIGAEEKLAKLMTETLMKKTILSKVSELTITLTESYASSFNVDSSKIASAFTLNFSEDELTRVITSSINNTKKSANSNLIQLGYQDKKKPTMISFYFNSFDGKEHFLSFIDNYNKTMKKTKQDDKVINYSDTTGILMNSVKTIVNAVSYVLIAFVSISLVVSSIMIGVITYISVYERTKEIGILRAIGASKHNISSIFNAETFIIGLLSGLFGIGFSYAVIPIINKVLHHFTGNIPLSATLKANNAIVLVILAIVLTLIGGLIPAKKASKKDPVEALRTE